MNYKLINDWLTEHEIVLEQSFVDAIRELAITHKKIMAGS